MSEPRAPAGLSSPDAAAAAGGASPGALQASFDTPSLEAVGRLSGRVAHDFNNLLSVVIGNLDLLCEISAGKETSALAQTALRGAIRAAELASHLLSFAGRQPLRAQAVDMNAVVGDMAGVLRRVLGPRVALEATLAPGLPPVMADQAQIEWALADLAGNARHAMPDGGTLTIETGTMVPPGLGRCAMLAVGDTGAGIPAEILPRVVEPFFSTKSGGKGISLSRIYGFARQSGGDLAIQSDVRTGTTVRLYLPLAASAEAPTLEEPELSARGEAILLAESGEDRRRVTLAHLAELGYRAVDVADTKAALAHLRDGPVPDLLLTDTMVAGPLSGAELAAEAQRLRPDIKIVMTSILGAAMATVGQPQGTQAILGAPYRRVDLAAALRRVLSE